MFGKVIFFQLAGNRIVGIALMTVSILSSSVSAPSLLVYLWNSLDPPTVPWGQLHNLRFQSLFRGIARDRLGYYGRLIVGGYPVRDAMVGEVSCEVPDDRAHKIVM